MQTTLIDYAKTVNHNTLAQVANLCYSGMGVKIYPGVLGKHCIKGFIRKHPVSFEYDENPLHLMMLVNKEVKHESCPNNFKNNFYHRKHIFIRAMMKAGKIDKILESEKHYHFFIGDYDFHQLKASFKNPIECDGTEEYIPQNGSTAIPFNIDDFRKCAISMLHYMCNLSDK
jgi:hypothetical protein